MKTIDATFNDSYQDRLGRTIAAHLSDASHDLPNDISERLKAARMQALAKRKVVKLQTASNVNTNGGSATLNHSSSNNNLWTRLGAFLPLVALVIGLLAIAVVQEQRRVDELAEIDMELLVDELPPAAYTDPGFLHYLNANRRD
jgi:hypothetical protein